MLAAAHASANTTYPSRVAAQRMRDLLAYGVEVIDELLAERERTEFLLALLLAVGENRNQSLEVMEKFVADMSAAAGKKQSSLSRHLFNRRNRQS